jgi:hypothetical protein
MALVVAFLAMGACGRGSVAPVSTAEPEQSVSSPVSPTATASPSVSDEERYPNLSRFAEPFARFAYKSGYGDCRVVGVEGAAEAWGGYASDPPSVARAYAAVMFPGIEEHREATFQGCLDAFESEQAR